MISTHRSARMQAMECQDFVDGAERLAKHQAKLWSAALRRSVRAVFLREELSLDERLALAADLVAKAKDIPKPPPIDIDHLLNALEAAAKHTFGITPTIALRAELRKALVSKPPPKLAKVLTERIFAKHLEFQELAKQTRH